MRQSRDECLRFFEAVVLYILKSVDEYLSTQQFVLLHVSGHLIDMIYFVDDEKNIRELIEAFLLQAGYEVQTFADGESFLEACNTNKPDLAVVDIMLPGVDGLELCRRIKRSDPYIPVIIVSAKDSPYDRVIGFAACCDDYLVKPFLPLELVYRIKMLLKRSSESSIRDKEALNESYSFGGLSILPQSRTAKLNGETLTLTPSEFDFLLYMLKNKERAIKREELLKYVWRTEYQFDTRATDDLVKRLRRKLRDLNSYVHIETVWGYGFRLSCEGDEKHETEKASV